MLSAGDNVFSEDDSRTVSPLSLNFSSSDSSEDLFLHAPPLVLLDVLELGLFLYYLVLYEEHVYVLRTLTLVYILCCHPMHLTF